MARAIYGNTGKYVVASSMYWYSAAYYNTLLTAELFLRFPFPPSYTKVPLSPTPDYVFFRLYVGKYHLFLAWSLPSDTNKSLTRTIRLLSSTLRKRQNCK